MEMSATEFLKFYISWGHTESCTTGKKFMESVLIHAVDISTCIHSYNDVVAVGPSRVVCYRKFEVFSFIELSPVGFNMINYHIYPWFINLGVISFWGFGQAEASGWISSCSGKLCGNVLFCDTPCTWYSLQDTFALACVHVSYISCTCPTSLGVF